MIPSLSEIYGYKGDANLSESANWRTPIDGTAIQATFNAMGERYRKNQQDNYDQYEKMFLGYMEKAQNSDGVYSGDVVEVNKAGDALLKFVMEHGDVLTADGAMKNPELFREFMGLNTAFNQVHALGVANNAVDKGWQAALKDGKGDIKGNAVQYKRWTEFQSAKDRASNPLAPIVSWNDGLGAKEMKDLAIFNYRDLTPTTVVTKNDKGQMLASIGYVVPIDEYVQSLDEFTEKRLDRAYDLYGAAEAQEMYGDLDEPNRRDKWKSDRVVALAGANKRGEYQDEIGNDGMPTGRKNWIDSPNGSMFMIETDSKILDNKQGIAEMELANDAQQQKSEERKASIAADAEKTVAKERVKEAAVTASGIRDVAAINAKSKKDVAAISGGRIEYFAGLTGTRMVSPKSGAVTDTNGQYVAIEEFGKNAVFTQGLSNIREAIKYINKDNKEFRISDIKVKVSDGQIVGIAHGNKAGDMEEYGIEELNNALNQKNKKDSTPKRGGRVDENNQEELLDPK